ncbi:MAG: glucose-6-phosphate isomerase [Alphaproteobacteria bacterium]
MATLYEQVTESCFSEKIGEGGLSAGAFETALGEAGTALPRLEAVRAGDRSCLLRLPGRKDDLEALVPVAGRYVDAFDDVVVLGTGGATLGGQTLAALAVEGPVRRPRRSELHFMDNIDPTTFTALIERLDMRGTGFLVISKSGGTAETLAQALVAFQAVREAVGEEPAARHFTMITGPGDSPLRRLATGWRVAVLDHDPDICGRFSVLSLVGLLPAMIAGLDAWAVREGAEVALRAALEAPRPLACDPAVGAAISVGLMRERGTATTVLMPYADRLATFGLWYRQLWAESLGKDGRGTTPVRAIGATDQHSQLQLYLAGPRDKMFTLITLTRAGEGPRIAVDLAGSGALAYLRGRTLGDLLDAEQRATADMLAGHGRPTREFRLRELNEKVMGALLMHFMLETIVAADLMGVDPFDQPAVEQGKALARAYLARTAAP